jgi:hypothetical protein
MLSNDEKEMYMMLLPQWSSCIAGPNDPEFYVGGAKYWLHCNAPIKDTNPWITLEEAFEAEMSKMYEK